MMAEKARVMGDQATRDLILAWTGKPVKYQELGGRVKPWNQALWVKMRYDIVLRATRMKFSQNEALKQKLLATQ